MPSGVLSAQRSSLVQVTQEPEDVGARVLTHVGAESIN